MMMMMMIIYSVKYATYLLERIFLHVNLRIVLFMLRHFCSNIFVGLHLWRQSLVSSQRSKLKKLRSCYNRCINRVSTIYVNIVWQSSILDVVLYSFDTLPSNSCVILRNLLLVCNSQLVHNVVLITICYTRYMLYVHVYTSFFIYVISFYGPCCLQ